MSPMNPTQVYVAHYEGVPCGTKNPIRVTDDPRLLTCRKCRKAIYRKIGQMLDQAVAKEVAKP